MTNYIIDQVNCFTEYKNVPTGLKIANQDNSTLYNSTLIAGVHYNNDQNNQDNNQNKNIDKIQ